MLPCLLITSDTAVRDTVKVGLDQTGTLEVDVSEDQWAVEMARTRPYRVVIADTALADGTDGFDLLRRIREVSPRAELLLVTRNRNQSRHLSRDKQQLGLCGFIHVPVEPTEFFRTVGRLLERLGNTAPAA